MNVRRSAAILAAVSWIGCAGMGGAPVALGADAPSATPSASASPALPAGLFGTADPTFDGVFRQSYALLAQHTAGQTPAAQAVGWLVGQQCANGGFPAYRADTHKECDAKASGSGPSTAPDSNSTAAAVQALTALGALEGGDATEHETVDKALAWLKSAQNGDGGWGYYPGLPSDANSTGLAVGALVGAGEDPTAEHSAKGGKTPYDALTALALPCTQDGAFGLRDAKSGKLTANADATAAGVLGGLGKGPVVQPSGQPGSKAACEDGGQSTVARAARNGAGYLRTLLARTPYLTVSLPGAKDQPDYGNTADAVIALAAAGEDKTAGASARWLADHAASWAKENGPAAYAGLILAAHATGTDPRHFGGTDLVRALDAMGPAPQRAAGPDDAQRGADRADRGKGDDKGGDMAVVWWVVGVCLVAGTGIGLLLSARRRHRA